jgi:hypothetical protein
MKRSACFVFVILKPSCRGSWRSIKLQPVGWAHLRKEDGGRASGLEAETDLPEVGQEVVLIDPDTS